MNVLVFTSLYPNNIWSNFGVFVKERMTTFARINGSQVRIVAPVPYFPPIKLGRRWKFSQVAPQEVIEGLPVYHPRYFITPKVGMSLYGLMMFLSVLPTIIRIKRDCDFNIIDAHYVYPDGFAAVLLGRFFKRPVVVSARGSDIHLFANFPLIRKLLQYTLSKANRVISVSQALKEAIIRLKVPEKKILVIPNGVDLTKFYPVSKGESRSKLGLPDKRVILSVGALIPGKGFHLLIKALKILTEEFNEKNLYLVIVGEGKFRKKLEEQVVLLNLNNQVRLVGAIPHCQLNLWYSAADLFCLVSDREGWPNVLLESLACGTPVIASNVWGIPEIIVSDQMGILTNRDEQEIAQGISLALKKSWQSETIVRYAREKTWDKVALSLSEVFASVLSGKE
jgi:glycosyltransferase involved in cell wall biosynthesis